VRLEHDRKEDIALLECSFSVVVARAESPPKYQKGFMKKWRKKSPEAEEHTAQRRRFVLRTSKL
jgi:hypothetical protein